MNEKDLSSKQALLLGGVLALAVALSLSRVGSGSLATERDPDAEVLGGQEVELHVLLGEAEVLADAVVGAAHEVVSELMHARIVEVRDGVVHRAAGAGGVPGDVDLLAIGGLASVALGVDEGEEARAEVGRNAPVEAITEAEVDEEEVGGVDVLALEGAEEGREGALGVAWGATESMTGCEGGRLIKGEGGEREERMITMQVRTDEETLRNGSRETRKDYYSMGNDVERVRLRPCVEGRELTKNRNLQLLI